MGARRPDVTTRLATVPVFVVRHARAGSRSRWQGDDRARPLSRAGRRQADALVPLLAPARPVRVLSSPFLRCVQTVAPLARHLGIDVEPEEALAEGTPWPDTRTIALGAPGPLVLCSHGDVILDLVRAVADEGVVDLAPDGPQLAKGSVWALEVGDGRIRAARYLPPPV